MGELTGIAWTDHTFNPWIGCAKVSPGCRNCYAETFSKNRMGLDVWGKNRKRRVASEAYWKNLTKFLRAAGRDGVRRRVFVASMADVFEDHGDVYDARDRLFRALPACAGTGPTLAGAMQGPGLDFQLLTKRLENVGRFVPNEWLLDRWPPNVWIGGSAENQAELDRRAPHLRVLPAPVRFLSCEPLLEPLDLSPHIEYVDWVIVGGESGPGARPFNLEWARSLRDQCKAAGVAFFMKQMGARPVGANGERFPLRHRKGEDPGEWPPLLRVQESAHNQVMHAPRERPILFSGPMIRAILEDRKTKTRRVIKPQPPEWTAPIRVDWFHPTVVDRQGIEQEGERIFGAYDEEGEWGRKSPYGAPGEHLWVRENWSPPYYARRLKPRHLDPDTPVWYWADGDPPAGDWSPPKPSIHIPRWASRILLGVTGVRVERVQDISEEDAKAEGVPRWANSDDIHNGHYLDRPLDEMWCDACKGDGLVPALGANLGVTETTCSDCDTARKLFRNLWDNNRASPTPVKRNGEISHYVSYPWDGEREVREHRGRPWYVYPNPWVWVVEFRRLNDA